MDTYATGRPLSEVEESVSELREDGIQILVNLGYRRPEAASKVDAALKRSPALQTPEDLIREVYRGERTPA